MMKRLVLVGTLLLFLLSTGLVSAASDGKEAINQETEHVQHDSDSDTTHATHDKNKCCKDDEEF